VVKKALILCPASLVKNWEKEFKKWLGNERILIFLVDNHAHLQQFLMNKRYSVMICSYEKYVSMNEGMNRINFDIVVCDEGHRLKNSAIKISTFLKAMKTQRRVIPLFYSHQGYSKWYSFAK
jgi:DNA repair and recombination protein RAD54B